MGQEQTQTIAYLLGIKLGKMHAVISRIGTIHEDVTTDVVGKIGSWQWLVTLVTTIMMAPSVFNQYEDIFLIYPSEAFCIPPESHRVYNSSLCFVTNGTYVSKCPKWNMKIMWLIWLKKSWLVFCDPHIRLLSTSIICRFGSMFGCVIYGFVADSFGRKMALLIDLFASLGLGLVITFCDSEGWFRLMIFLKSLSGSASFYMGILIICEISSNSWRATLSVVAMTPRLFAILGMVVLANTTPNAETYSFLACFFGALCVVLLRWCPESPQWLLYNRKIHVAEKILKHAAKVNGIELCSDFKIRPVNYKAYNSLEETTTCVEVLTVHNVRTMIVVMIFIWTFYCFLWSSLYVKVYKAEKLTDLVLKVLCCICVLGCLTIMLSKRLYLRSLLQIHVLTTGALTISVMFVKNGMLRSIGSSIAVSSGVMVHALLLALTPRLFATTIRATAVGCCLAAGHLGSILSYLMLLLLPMDDVTFSAVVLAIAVALVGLSCLLPDVDGRELPDVVEDMDYFSELSKPLRWVAQKTDSPSTEEVQMRIHSFGSASRAVHSHSETRVPAQRIGVSRIRRAITRFTRRTSL